MNSRASAEGDDWEDFPIPARDAAEHVDAIRKRVAAGGGFSRNALKLRASYIADSLPPLLRQVPIDRDSAALVSAAIGSVSEMSQ